MPVTKPLTPMRTEPTRLIPAILLSAMVISCGTEPRPATEEPVVETTEATPEEDVSNAEDMIRQMPSPIEMAILVKHSGGEYNASLLNDVKSIEEYLTNGKRTINMGVYSADVGYTSLYKQTQETVFYLNNVRKLSESIGLSDAFDQSLFDRVEANIENRDSLLHILSGGYDVANEYLKNNNRMNTSVLMLGGGWIESMFLAANLGVDGGRPEDIVALRILEQDIVLEKIVKTMSMVEGDPLVDEFAGKLEELSTFLVSGDLRIGEGEEATVNKEKMEVVYTMIDDIRGWAVA